MSFDLLEAYLREHPEASHCSVGFQENALFQDYHGLKSFRMVKIVLWKPNKSCACFLSYRRLNTTSCDSLFVMTYDWKAMARFMEMIRGGKARFDPESRTASCSLPAPRLPTSC